MYAVTKLAALHRNLVHGWGAILERSSFKWGASCSWRFGDALCYRLLLMPLRRVVSTLAWFWDTGKRRLRESQAQRLVFLDTPKIGEKMLRHAQRGFWIWQQSATFKCMIWPLNSDLWMKFYLMCNYITIIMVITCTRDAVYKVRIYSTLWVKGNGPICFKPNENPWTDQRQTCHSPIPRCVLNLTEIGSTGLTFLE